MPMLRNFAIKALFLFVSACLYPAAGMAIEEHDSIRVGRLFDGIEAHVDISSAEGRMSAVPRFIIEDKFRNRMRGAAEGKEQEMKSLAKIIKEEKAESLAKTIREGGISYSNGVRLVDRVKDAVKKRRQEKTGNPIISGLEDDINGATGANPAEKKVSEICGSFDFRNLYFRLGVD
jgi:hypothetical protein